MAGPTVGIVANPASGRDIRRLVSGASVFDNAEKGFMILRLLAGLGAVGVERAIVMPAGDGVAHSLLRNLRGRTGALAAQPLPELEFLDMTLRGDADDTVRAVTAMRERGAGAIVVLGGDGTHRVVAKRCRDVPLCAMSTGTNNVFPELREATVAGLAAGLVATDRVDPLRSLRREKLLRVIVGGERTDCALVDVALSSDRWVGARALWRPEDLSEAFLTFASPCGVGLSAAAGQLDPVPRDAGWGLHLRLAPPERAARVVTAALAPGLVTAVGVDEARRIGPGEVVRTRAPAGGCVALDGEREIELAGGEDVRVTLDEGPLVVDVDRVMVQAAALQLLNGASPGPAGRHSSHLAHKEDPR
ncbi:MAG: NAD(+)/NADH kinase [Actinomycetota bacterium]|nr:NAD(+)/NADH kinase [Actinomycetota bacterium]